MIHLHPYLYIVCNTIIVNINKNNVSLTVNLDLVHMIPSPYFAMIFSRNRSNSSCKLYSDGRTIFNDNRLSLPSLRMSNTR